MSKTPSALSREERDLLIRLDTKMTGMESTLNDLKGSITGRLLNLESNSLSKIEFNTVVDDHESRLRTVEQRVWIASGAAAMLGTIGGYLWSLFT